MATNVKDLVKPDYNFQHPSERAYVDGSLSTAEKLVMTDLAKSGKDYGIVDAPKVEPITASQSETGNGAKSP